MPGAGAAPATPGWNLAIGDGGREGGGRRWSLYPGCGPEHPLRTGMRALLGRPGCFIPWDGGGCRGRMQAGEVVLARRGGGSDTAHVSLQATTPTSASSAAAASATRAR